MFDSLDLSQWLGILQLFESFYKAKPSGFSVEALGTSSATIQVVENGLLHIFFFVHFLFPHVLERIQSWIFKGIEHRTIYETVLSGRNTGASDGLRPRRLRLPRLGASLIIFLSLSTFCIDFWNISAVSAKV